MTERAFDDGFWGNLFVQKLSKDAKLLYGYSFTNKHCNPAGLYEITYDSISFDTKIDQARLPELFQELQNKVEYYPDDALIWVKNFIARQTKSSKFLQAAAKSMVPIKNPALIKKVLDYNLQKHSISIPYQYYIDKLSILTRASDLSCSDTDTDTDNSSLFSGSLFSLFEEKIGRLSPAASENLKEAIEHYSPAQVKDAIVEAAKNGGRSFRYVEKILTTWEETGRKPSPSSGRADRIKEKYGYTGGR